MNDEKFNIDTFIHIDGDMFTADKECRSISVKENGYGLTLFLHDREAAASLLEAAIKIAHTFTDEERGDQ